MERWIDKHVTGEGKASDVDKRQEKTREEDTRPPPVQLLRGRESNEVAMHGEVQTWSPHRISPDKEEVVNEDEEETQLNIAEI